MISMLIQIMEFLKKALIINSYSSLSSKSLLFQGSSSTLCPQKKNKELKNNNNKNQKASRAIISF